MFDHSPKRMLAACLTVSLLACLLAQPALAVTFFKQNRSPGDLYADILGSDGPPQAAPEDPLIWDHADITWKFDSSFLQYFPNQIQQDAVRYAFNEWETATGPLGFYESYIADYSRWGQEVYDMKTIALHELGHGVGLGHPFDGVRENNNYRYEDYGVAYDGTQEWEATGDIGWEVMGYGAVGYGLMNRYLGWDEINGCRFSYGPGYPLNFIELDPSDPNAADITIMAENLGPDVPGDRQVIAWNNSPGTGCIQMWNSALADKIGIQPKIYNAEWNLKLSSGPAYGIAMQMNKSSDADVLGQRSHTTGNHYLQTYLGSKVGNDSWHTWTDPDNNHTLVGETSVGLKFDKETWGVTQAWLLDINGVPTGSELGATSAAAYSLRTINSGAAFEGPFGTWVPEETILEQGLVLRGTPGAPTQLTRVMLADVTGMNLDLADLNSDLLNIVSPIDLCVPCMGNPILGLDGVEHVLLFTDGSHLTPEMLADPAVQYHVIDNSYILTFDELLVVLESEMILNGEVLQHRSYQILGQRMTGVADTTPLLAGDVNGDGFVGGLDLTIIMSNWGASGLIRPMGDLSGDGFVGGLDYTEVLSNWGQGTPPEAVPEPATVALLLLAGLPGLIRRW